MEVHHGKLHCRDCFTGTAVEELRLGQWRIQNDPCYWGSSEPEVLVLGFSKGFTQAKAVRESTFEDIPFKGMRDRLTDGLRALGVIEASEHVNHLVSGPESRVAFASLIRCSVARVNEKATVKAGREVLECSGPLIKKSFKEIPEVISNCTKRYLAALPETVKTIVLLGVDDQYVSQCQAVIRKLFVSPGKQLNKMAIEADGRLWVWISHPSGSNGHFGNWIKQIGSSGEKFNLASEALRN